MRKLLVLDHLGVYLLTRQISALYCLRKNRALSETDEQHLYNKLCSIFTDDDWPGTRIEDLAKSNLVALRMEMRKLANDINYTIGYKPTTKYLTRILLGVLFESNKIVRKASTLPQKEFWSLSNGTFNCCTMPRTNHRIADVRDGGDSHLV